MLPDNSEAQSMNSGHGSKLAFASKKEAIASATVAQWRYNSRLKAYQCKQCGQWHLATDYESNASV
jgi:hypothetical protein